MLVAGSLTDVPLALASVDRVADAVAARGAATSTPMARANDGRRSGDVRGGRVADALAWTHATGAAGGPSLLLVASLLVGVGTHIFWDSVHALGPVGWRALPGAAERRIPGNEGRPVAALPVVERSGSPCIGIWARAGGCAARTPVRPIGCGSCRWVGPSRGVVRDSGLSCWCPLVSSCRRRHGRIGTASPRPRSGAGITGGRRRSSFRLAIAVAVRLASSSRPASARI